ncbi:hypothetical protein [Paracerasibacillus soli]|uniref:Uncharacterized protein n=1 Tax=Paracerasibacillus soli TaxID=480284 RepID=A0ABU5CS05_9BACI|nr:hypothetical protein [Virgibacillus soli]MDY0409162.1 hypothetical protein [Virgibacillus soli]
MRLLRQVSLVLVITFAIVMISSLVKNSNKNIKSWSMIMLVISMIQYFYLKWQMEIIPESAFFGAPTVNPTVYWAINVAIVMLMLMISSHFIAKKPEGATIANYGVKASVKTVLTAFVTAVLAIGVGYGLLYIIDAVFKTDFRLWTFAVKTFEWHHVIALLKYAPLFFIYYFIAGISVNMNTTGEKYEGFKGYIVSILHFVGGLVLYLIYQYGLLFTTGVAGYPAESLSSIIVIGLVPVLAVAVYSIDSFIEKQGMSMLQPS